LDAHQVINDEAFRALVGRLKALRAFLSQAAIPLAPSPNSDMSIGKIYTLHFRKDGRAATADEWDYVDSEIQKIYAILNSEHRRAFLATETPWLVPILAITLLLLGLIDILILVVFNTLGWNNPLIFAGYVVFSTALGALGALGALSLNAILVHNDIKFDPTNTRLIAIRIISGAMFGCIITLPFGYENFYSFILKYNATQAAGPSSPVAQASLFLLPFIFGYSTSAILLILDKFAGGLERFFDGSDKPASRKK